MREVRAVHFRKRRLLVRRRSPRPSGLRAASYGESRRTGTPLQALLRSRRCRMRSMRPELPAARVGVGPSHQSRAPLSKLPRGSHRERARTPLFLRDAARGLATETPCCARCRRQTDSPKRVRSCRGAQERGGGRPQRSPRDVAAFPRGRLNPARDPIDGSAEDPFLTTPVISATKSADSNSSRLTVFVDCSAVTAPPSRLEPAAWRDSASFC